MEALLERISKLVEAKHLIPAEQVLMSTVGQLNDLLQNDYSNEILEKIEKLLLSIYSVNNGKFSIQCAIFIASTLCKTYEKMKKPEYWGATNLAIDLTTTTTVVATGYIVKHLGHNFKSQLPRMVEHFLKQNSIDLAVLYALTHIFKVGTGKLASFMPKTIDFCRRILLKCNSMTMQMALKFLRTCVKLISSGECKTVSITQILDLVRVCLNSSSPFVKNDVAALVAQCAYAPFINVETKKVVSEWAVGAMKHEGEGLDFTRSFEMMASFPQVIDTSIEYFLRFLGPEIICLNHASLMKFIRISAFSATPKLISMLPSDIIFSHFRAVLKEEVNEQQIKLIPLLCPDDGSLDEAAIVAHRACLSPKVEIRRAAKMFFTHLSETHPHAALPVVAQCLNSCLQNSANHAICHLELTCASLILSSVQQQETAIKEFKDKIHSVLKLAFENPNPETLIFCSVLSFVSTLTKQYAEDPLVKKAISVATAAILKENAQKELPTYAKLLRSLCMLMVKSKDEGTARHVVVASVMSNIKFSPRLIISLAKLVPRVLADQPLAVSAALLIVREAKKVAPTTSCVMSNLSRPLPLGSNLLYQTQELTYKQQKDDSFLRAVYQELPSVLRACPQSDTHVIAKEILGVQQHTQSTMLLCLTITKNRDLLFALPSNFPSVCLGLLMTPGNEKINQLICENLSFYIAAHQELLGKIFNHIDSHPSVHSTLLLDSLFAHMIIPNQYISRAIVFLDCRMKDKTELQFAVHALSTLILTHAMQVASLGITANQFNVLLGALHTPYSMAPVTLFMCCECFRFLIETVSSDITSENSGLTEQISIILRTFEYTPVKYSKELYFECARAVYTFTHALSKFAPIEYPASPSVSYQTALAACAAFSDLMKFEKKNFDVDTLLPKLLILLQATKDKRASTFIELIAATMSVDDLSFWISTIRRILITGSLLAQSTSTIEPAPEVKLCMLHVAKYIVPVLNSAPILKTEFLDDLISSVCRATETERVALQEAAFPVLQKVIELFRNRTADEGGRLLDLYDSQFSQTVKVGFQLQLDVSGGFLSTYLSFSTANVDSDPENCTAVLVVYLTGLKACQQRTAAYFQLATHLCTVARRHTTIHDLIKPFLDTLSPIFGDIVIRAMKLYKNQSDWRGLTAFRSLAQSFYRELLSAFVWLQSNDKVYIDYDVLVSFLCIELKHAQEHWMSIAAFDALCVALKTVGSKINTQLVKLTLECAAAYRSVTKDQISELINSCSSLLKEDESYDDLRVTVFSLCIYNSFAPAVIAHLLKSDGRRVLSKYASSVLEKTLEYFLKKQINAETASTLITLLLDHTKSIAGSITEKVLGLGEEHRDFKLTILGRTLAVKESSLPLDGISRFCITSFKRGGMQLVARTLIHNPECGIALLMKGSAKAAFLLASKDAKNARAYLLFLQLGLQVTNENSDAKAFANSLFRLCASLSTKLKQGSALDRKLFLILIRIIRDCAAITSLEESYNMCSDAEKTSIITMMNVCINAERQRRKTEQLVAFSTNQRSSRNEWQTLDIED